MIKLGVLLKGFYQHITLDAALANTDVSGLTLDSRDANSHVVFIAVQGHVVDGRDFIETCDADIVIAQASTESIDNVKGKVVISLVDLPQKVSALAGKFYGDPSKKIAVTAFTGTNGKTTCAYLYSQLIARLSGACGHIGTLGYGVFANKKYESGTTGTSNCLTSDCLTPDRLALDDAMSIPLKNTGLTTPSSVDCQKILNTFCGKTHYAAVEASSHALEQSRVKNIFFSGAVFTNLSRDHLDYHKTMLAYFESKLTLFTNHSIDFAVVNLNDEYGIKILNVLKKTVDNANTCLNKKVKTIGFSLTSTTTNNHIVDDVIYVQSAKFSSKGIDVNIAGSYGPQHFFTPLIGTYNLANVLAVIACAVNHGFHIEDVCAAVAHFKAVPGRLEPVKSSDNQPSVFVDFAHTPDAVKQVISETRAICQGALWVVLGCGGSRDKGKRPLMAQAALMADYSVFTSDNPRNESPDDILNDMLLNISTSQSVHRIVSREQAITFAIDNAKPNDIVLIAGKGHEQYQIIQDQYLPFSDMDVAYQALDKKCMADKLKGAAHVR